MILATVRMKIPPQKRDEVSRTLKSMVRQIMIRPGCLSSRLFHDACDEAVFVCEQVWRDQDDLDLYLRSDDGRCMLLVMEMAGEAPEIKFQTISNPAGLEVVEKARGCKRDDDV